MKTTVKQIYEAACRSIYETPHDDDDLQNSFPYHLQLALLHSLPTENAVRAFDGRELITADDIPDIGTVDDTALPFDERILRLAVPYCIKSKFLEDDNSKKAESVLEWNKFVGALEEISPAVLTEVAEW